MAASALSVSSLRCEYLANPLGIAERAPRLSWAIESERRGARQAAYRLRVASTADKLAAGEADFWDSGRVESDRTTHIPYAGRAFDSRTACHWGVEVWDDTGASAISEPAFWTMGLLEKSEWRARWIAADPQTLKRDPEAIAPTLTEPGTPALFRKQFHVPGPVKRATVYASARGVFELRIGGRRVGEDLFAPEWTDYTKRIHYRTYDVTGLIKTGGNAIGAFLGDGWWSGYVGWQETRGRYGLQNSLLVQLEIELESGGSLVVASDGTWRCHTGPILSSDFMMGEIYDARRERTGWDQPDLDDNQWLPALEIAAPAVPLVPQPSEPVRITETMAPKAPKEIRPGIFIYDLGQNISGWVRLRVSAPAGTRVTIRVGERLSPDGTLYTENLRRAKSTDIYVCKGGGGEEVWEPRFTFHGFQYVELSGLPAAPGTNAVTGCVIHSAMPAAGHFECSHPGVNRLWMNGHWSQRDNFLTVPTDCPQRDERLGWTGDAEVFIRTASYNRDVAAFFTKWMIDIEDAQTPEGIFPDTAPRLNEKDNFIGLGNLGGAAGWADAGVIIPWTIWRVYGDQRIIEKHWKAMTAWLAWIEKHNPNGHRVRELGNNYGDWLCIPSDTTFGTHSPMKNLLATAFWANDAAMLAQMARALGREDDAKRYDKMFEHVRAAFQKEYLLADGKLSVDTQTAYLLTLAMNLLPEDVRVRAADHLVENIKALDWHLSTGFIGIRYLNPILTRTGHADVAYRLLLTEDYPSWLYPVLHGATTIWERWNGWTEQDGFFNPHMNSFNHYSLGSIGEWFFSHVAGIELDPEIGGFQKFLLQPTPGGKLAFARATYRTMHGEIASGWKHAGKQLEWSVRIPANTTARVRIPSEAGTNVTEGGLPVEQAAGLKVIGREGRFLLCEAGAGTYNFVSAWQD